MARQTNHRDDIGAALPCDGVICFGGEDWWYHNRGHYDLQMMRQLSARLPVLYVNSIGMRVPAPSEGRIFWRRITRKLASVRRGLVEVADSFHVLSPLVWPGRRGMRVTRWMLERRVRHAAQRLGITRPLVWVACPAAADAVASLSPTRVVYQRTDRYESYPGVDQAWIRGRDAALKARADVTVFCSSLLLEEEAAACRAAVFVDHGVDLDRFAAAADDQAHVPPDVAAIPHPRVGFIGGIDDHTFDAALLLDVATRLPDTHFVLVGACSLPDGWCDRPNVHLLGQRPYERVADYMAGCDALIMPWRRSAWIDACNPVKLKEYLAVGRPIVSTPFSELIDYAGLVRVAHDAETFAFALRAALRDPGSSQTRRDRVRGETWAQKVTLVCERLLDVARDTTSGENEDVTPVSRRFRTSALRSSPAPPCDGDRPANPLDAPPCEATGGGAVLSADGRTITVGACLLLAGGLSASPLVAAADRSVLDLWLSPDDSILEEWLRVLDDLHDQPDHAIPLRVIHDSHLPAPWPRHRPAELLTIEREVAAFRGPAGVVADACRRYAPHVQVVVAEAARYATVPLRALLLQHVARDADVTLAVNGDGSPAGIFVVRCSALSFVPAIGFMDLKQQWLPRLLEADLRCDVHRLDDAGALPLRTRADLLRAARHRCGLAPDDAWRVICPGAHIGRGARIEQSVIMPGATVDADALVVRSIVCPGGHAPIGSEIVETIVGVPSPALRGREVA